MPAYFTPTRDGLAPDPAARSPWTEDMLHGRLLGGLAARAVEHAGLDSSFRLTRLTVDMFKSPPMEPICLATSTARAGRRVHVIDVSMTAGSVEVARASAVLLRTGPHPVAAPWQPDVWEVPQPEELPAATAFGGWDLRMVSKDGFSSADRKRVWTRDTWDLVDGEPLSPLLRAALAADLPNPLANAGPSGLQFINADLTLTLGRLPAGPWIGLDVTHHIGADGIAIGMCVMYDTAGPVGWSSVTAVANPQGIPG